MKTFIIIIIFCFISCNVVNQSDKFINSTNEKTISGNILNNENIKIGVFSNIYWFTINSLGERDSIYCEFPFTTSGNFLPLYFVSTNTNGNYEIILPLEANEMGELIAWIDSNNDGYFDLGTEPGFLPIKDINEISSVISSFYPGDSDRSSNYLIRYTNEEGSQIADLETMGTDGFNFYID